MQEENKNKPLFQYARYSGMAFQMFGIILIGVWGGYELDKCLNSKPVFTVILTVLSVVLAIYQAVRDLLKKK